MFGKNEIAVKKSQIKNKKRRKINGGSKANYSGVCRFTEI
jgi:hypothetical protein